MPNYYEGRFYKTENFIGKDENNLYRALAHLEYQDQEMHAVVAKDIEQYIRKNPDQFKDYRISRFGWPARKVNDKASTIRIGSRKYLYVNAEGNGGALFSAFKKTTSSEYAVLHKLPANTEGEMPTYIGSEYSNTKDKNLHQRISKGLVLENGHYEVFARPGSEALSMVPPKAKRT
ncbi:hypothetical protein PTTG_26829 [Puccinia triticina 1-1 BBBD Race 1]|uniref:Uncharacterized protein n=2 Tax=Puccinia triticina TaxID=208348 RepID=A0A180GQ65_PUCT1|nr:uncharacterized protein PtA15_14A59 [Puccinia triticina]OAV94966.1 hypothetical protein PTTG_26829 [Puccinia triticina 1-1 BBBD Race 1]WAQ91178.1 hypothetical protein PtA15_14A59 [Puccinia triticina]